MGMLYITLCLFNFTLFPFNALALSSDDNVLGAPVGLNPVPADNLEGIPDEDNINLIGAVRVIVNAFLAIVALIAVIVIIIAGFRLIISGGDEESARAARRQILYAIIGLVIILLSAIIVNFVISLFNVGTETAPVEGNKNLRVLIRRR